jgi:hypothetical protein
MERLLRSAALAAGVFLSVPSAGGIAYAAADGRELPPAGAVTALSVVPGSGHADVVIAVEGPSIEIIDFVLENPHRVVVDLKGATLSMPARLYDKISRGGITNIRMAQWKPEIVRVVLDLDGAREYTVVREDHDVRVSVTGPVDFAAWRTPRWFRMSPSPRRVQRPPLRRPRRRSRWIRLQRWRRRGTSPRRSPRRSRRNRSSRRSRASAWTSRIRTFAT